MLHHDSSWFVMATSAALQVPLDQAPWQQLQPLIDVCYPRPPRDVFGRVLAASHQRQRLWLFEEGKTVHGMVMLSPHSKGGHLENLAVVPAARGRGYGRLLVQTVLAHVGASGPGMVSLTTRIPSYFELFGFQPCGQLADGSTAMMTLLPGPHLSDSSL